MNPGILSFWLAIRSNLQQGVGLDSQQQQHSGQGLTNELIDGALSPSAAVKFWVGGRQDCPDRPQTPYGFFGDSFLVSALGSAFFSPFTSMAVAFMV